MVQPFSKSTMCLESLDIMSIKFKRQTTRRRLCLAAGFGSQRAEESYSSWAVGKDLDSKERGRKGFLRLCQSLCTNGGIFIGTSSEDTTTRSGELGGETKNVRKFLTDLLCFLYRKKSPGF